MSGWSSLLNPFLWDDWDVRIDWNAFYYAMMQLKFTHASNYLDDDEYDKNK